LPIADNRNETYVGMVVSARMRQDNRKAQGTRGQASTRPRFPVAESGNAERNVQPAIQRIRL